MRSSGNAVIEKGDMRSAYKNALNNAIIGAVREYYKSVNSSKIPDVSQEYVKFVNRYTILSKKVSGYTVHVSISAELDDVALQDAGVFISNPVNTAVFVFSGIPSGILSGDEQAEIIDGVLSSKHFSTNEQKNFTYGISDMENGGQVSGRFKNVYSEYLFKFAFKPSFDGLKDPDNSCELTAVTDIISKNDRPKTLKIETSSLKVNERQCVSEAMRKAVNSTVDYVRSNIIPTPGQGKRLNSYKIKAVNFNNMVGTNNFISALKQRGFIYGYKAVSFSGKEVIFQIESYFTEKELASKLKAVKSDDMNFTYSADSEGIVLDFAPAEQQP